MMNKRGRFQARKLFTKKKAAPDLKVRLSKLPERERGRQKDPARAKRDILRAATIEFTRHGLGGARVDRIAKNTSFSKRMIYYYFKGKTALYQAVLEEAYRGIRAYDAALRFEDLSPIEAIRTMIGATLTYEEMHPEFVSLISTENIHQARFMTRTAELQKANGGIILALDNILSRGRAENLFRTDVSAIDVHIMISAFCFFRMANRFTFKAVFNHDMMKASERARFESFICEAVLNFLAIAPLAK